MVDGMRKWIYMEINPSDNKAASTFQVHKHMGIMEWWRVKSFSFDKRTLPFGPAHGRAHHSGIAFLLFSWISQWLHVDGLQARFDNEIENFLFHMLCHSFLAFVGDNCPKWNDKRIKFKLLSKKNNRTQLICCFRCFAPLVSIFILYPIHKYSKVAGLHDITVFGYSSCNHLCSESKHTPHISAT
jgi:hypothetical protein